MLAVQQAKSSMPKVADATTEKIYGVVHSVSGPGMLITIIELNCFVQSPYCAIFVQLLLPRVWVVLRCMNWCVPIFSARCF